MPRFSIIVPVHNVAPYLRPCLDSLLSQGVTDIEIICVNDASTDNSAQILREYDDEHDEIRFIDLTENVGLGKARNAGLDVATGEFLMFVDSDDWVEAGALLAINERLTEVDPDVLIFDYARAGWDGKVSRNRREDLFRFAGADVFTLDDHPDLVRLLMVVWNKIYRRDFINELGLRFSEGYYEDLPWTYPVLISARRIALLDRVCYMYRQRREGNILRTSSKKHFEVFDQYHRVFEFVDQHPEVARWRPLLAHRMAEHCLTILRKGEERVPNQHRREFFMTASKMVGQYLTEIPPGAEARLEERFLRDGAFTQYEALQRARSYKRPVTRRMSKYKTRVGRYRIGLWRRAYRLLRLLPVDPKLAVFAAYWFNQYACNPQAIFEKMRELSPEVTGVWVINRAHVSAIPDGVSYVLPRTFRYYWVLARAKFLVNNVNFPDEYRKRRGQLNLQTQHGTPLKTMGVDLKKYPVAAKDMNFKKLLERTDRWDYNLSTNRFSTEIWQRVNPASYKTLEFGYPRNDVFYTATAEDVARIRKELGIGEGKVAVLYAPTFRDWESEFLLQLDLPGFIRSLSDEYVVLLRGHYFYDQLPEAAELAELEAAGRFIDVSAHPDVSQVALASDVLVTDYSSLQFDYANLDRPIVLYAPDFSLYRQLRGVYFDILAHPPGAVAQDEAELSRLFVTQAYESADARAKLRAFRRKFCQFDDGHASDRVVRKLFQGKKVRAPMPLGRRHAPAPAAGPIWRGTSRRRKDAETARTRRDVDINIDDFLKVADSLTGTFTAQDSALFDVVNRVQLSFGVQGHMLEIGGSFSAAAALMAYYLREGDKLIVCDPFDARDGGDPSAPEPQVLEQRRPRMSREEFEEVYRRFHGSRPRIQQKASAALHPKRLATPMRFVHINGSTAYRQLASDLRLSHQVLGPDGVVVVDGVNDAMQPSVSAAVWEAVAADGLVPICITESKFYGTWQPWAPRLLRALKEFVDTNPVIASRWQSLGRHDIMRVIDRPKVSA